jgi:hypothetical protein
MKFYRETTVWADTTPNHTYLLSDGKDKLYGYITANSKTNTVFKKFIRFDARGRTFVEVKELGEINLEDALAEERWEVKGSKGDTHVVQKIEGVLQCSCSGFKFRGHCRHVKEIENV